MTSHRAACANRSSRQAVPVGQVEVESTRSTDPSGQWRRASRPECATPASSNPDPADVRRVRLRRHRLVLHDQHPDVTAAPRTPRRPPRPGDVDRPPWRRTTCRRAPGRGRGPSVLGRPAAPEPSAPRRRPRPAPLFATRMICARAARTKRGYPPPVVLGRGVHRVVDQVADHRHQVAAPASVGRACRRAGCPG